MNLLLYVLINHQLLFVSSCTFIYIIDYYVLMIIIVYYDMCYLLL